MSTTHTYLKTHRNIHRDSFPYNSELDRGDTAVTLACSYHWDQRQESSKPTISASKATYWQRFCDEQQSTDNKKIQTISATDKYQWVRSFGRMGTLLNKEKKRLYEMLHKHGCVHAAAMLINRISWWIFTTISDSFFVPHPGLWQHPERGTWDKHIYTHIYILYTHIHTYRIYCIYMYVFPLKYMAF